MASVPAINLVEVRLTPLEEARSHARAIERFCYKLVRDSENEAQTIENRNILRLAVGLRRKLDEKGER